MKNDMENIAAHFAGGRLSNQPTYAVESHKYTGPASNGVKFESERGRGRYDRIKQLLREWAAWQVEKKEGGYPRQSAFATERVQSSNRSTDTFIQMPDIIKKLNERIEQFAPGFKRLINVEYIDRRASKIKHKLLQVPQCVYYQRLAFVHEQLTHAMFGESNER